MNKNKINQQKRERRNKIKEKHNNGELTILNEGSRICCLCKIEKNITDFNVEKQEISGRSYTCKQCKNKKGKERTHKNKLKNKNEQNIVKEGTQKCSKCKIEKDILEFGIYRGSSNGRNHCCKKCVVEVSKEYRKTERWKENKREYMRKKRKDVGFKIHCSVSQSIVSRLKKQNKSKNNISCFKHFSYTVQELKDHLEKQFDENMNWQNYGSYWHIDHIYPQSLLPYDSMEHINFKVCWDLQNLRPLEAIKNSIKHTKTNEESEKLFLDLMNKYKGGDI